MSSARIVLWFAWFLACNWLRGVIVLFRERTEKEAIQ
jgi:hypothetical protein